MTDMAEPTRQTARTDSELPKWAKSSTDMAEPKRHMLRRETVEPKWT